METYFNTNKREKEEKISGIIIASHDQVSIQCKSMCTRPRNYNQRMNHHLSCISQWPRKTPFLTPTISNKNRKSKHHYYILFIQSLDKKRILKLQSWLSWRGKKDTRRIFSSYDDTTLVCAFILLLLIKKMLTIKYMSHVALSLLWWHLYPHTIKRFTDIVNTMPCTMPWTHKLRYVERYTSIH